MPEPESQPQTPSTRRLVIRVKIPNGTPQAPIRRRLSRGALLVILGAAAALLSWVGVSIFRTNPTPAPAVTEVPKPAAETAEPRSAEVEPRSTEAKPVEPEVREQPAAPPSPINEVIPDVPRSARETIRGTVRVSIRVIIDKEGTVIEAIADDPGPSRYFERLAVEAAKKWTFTPADSQAQRVMLVRFNFKRGGTTARANSVQ
jgi:TonB family protein